MNTTCTADEDRWDSSGVVEPALRWARLRCLGDVLPSRPLPTPSLPVTRYNPLDPDFAREEYPFYWLARVHGVYTLEMEKALKSVGLDVPTWRTLMILKEQGASSMSDIALHAVAKLSTVTKAVYRIQEEGLVETSTSPQDARVTLVKITAAGRRALERSQLATQHIVSRSFEGMTPGQLRRLNESLRVILDNLSPRHSEVSGAPLRRGGATEKA